VGQPRTKLFSLVMQHPEKTGETGDFLSTGLYEMEKMHCGEGG